MDCSIKCDCQLSNEERQRFMIRMSEVQSGQDVLELIAEINDLTPKGGVCLQILKCVPASYVM